MYKKDSINELIEIEMRMVEVRGLFSTISGHMMEGSIGILRFPVNMSQLKAMTALAEDSVISMGELCKMANVKMPSLTEVVDRFEEEGVLKRIRDKGDRRVVKVSLTDKGKKIHREVLRRRAHELTNIFGALNKKDRATLSNSLKNVTGILNKITKENTKKGR